MTSTSSIPQGSPFAQGQKPTSLKTGSPPVTQRRGASPSPKLSGPSSSPRAKGHGTVGSDSPMSTRSRRFTFNALTKPPSPSSHSSSTSSLPSTPKSSVWSRTSSIISNFFGRSSSPPSPSAKAQQLQQVHHQQQQQQQQQQQHPHQESSDSDTDPAYSHMTIDGSTAGSKSSRPSITLPAAHQVTPGTPAPSSAHLDSKDTYMDDASPVAQDDEAMYDGAGSSPLSAKENKTPVRSPGSSHGSRVPFTAADSGVNKPAAPADDSNTTGDSKVAEWMIMSSIQSAEDDEALHQQGASAELARQAASLLATSPPPGHERRDSVGSSDGSVVYSHSPGRSARARRARRAHRRSESAPYEFDDSSEEGSGYHGAAVTRRRPYSRRSDGSDGSASSHASTRFGAIDDDAPLTDGDMFATVDGRSLKHRGPGYAPTVGVYPEDSEEDFEMESSSVTQVTTSSGTEVISSHVSYRHFHSVPKHTLVLDLDETLVHSTIKRPERYDLEVPVTIEDTHCVFYVRLRPYVREFLAKVCEWYNVVIFTAGLKQYAAPVVEFLDPNGAVKDSFYRESCIQLGGCFIKDLRMANPDMAATFIVDNSPAAYCLFQDNAVPIISWMGDEEDVELLHLLSILNDIRQASDVRPLLKAHFGDQIAAQSQG